MNTINYSEIKRNLLPIILSGLWITVSEFLRNEFLLKSYWVDHFNSIGLVFETLPVNGILWMIWSFMLAYLILKLREKFSYRETLILSWIPAFVMMWIVIYNLQVLPLMILVFTIPLSLLEIVIAIIIIKKVQEFQEN
jgi:hypothetical protein